MFVYLLIHSCLGYQEDNELNREETRGEEKQRSDEESDLTSKPLHREVERD